MTKNEFKIHMGRLIECYGEKHYPESRTEQIWEWAKHLESKLFYDLTSALIADCQHPPLLAKFKEYYGNARARHPQKRIECEYCNGEGFILDQCVPANAHACKCEAGRKIPKYVKRWDGPWVRMVPTTAELEDAQINASAIIEEIMGKMFQKMDTSTDFEELDY